MSRGTRDGEFGNVGRMVSDRLRQVLDGAHIAQHTLYAIAQAAQRSTGQEQDINHINCLVGAMACPRTVDQTRLRQLLGRIGKAQRLL